jgi:hypothetical protein
MPFVARRIGVRKPSESATSVAGGDRQGELFALYRYHAVFTDSPLTLVQAEKTHRAHAIIEQVHADLRSGPLICRRFVRWRCRLTWRDPGQIRPPAGSAKWAAGRLVFRGRQHLVRWPLHRQRQLSPGKDPTRCSSEDSARRRRPCTGAGTGRRRIRRYDPDGDPEPHWETYQAPRVPAEPGDGVGQARRAGRRGRPVEVQQFPGVGDELPATSTQLPRHSADSLGAAGLRPALPARGHPGGGFGKS